MFKKRIQTTERYILGAKKLNILFKKKINYSVVYATFESIYIYIYKMKIKTLEPFSVS